jgi:hypothetical protein
MMFMLPIMNEAVAAPAAVSPKPTHRPRRRIFTTANKLRVLAELDRRSKP